MFDYTELLWLLKQIYGSNNSYYDSEKKLLLHHVSSKFSDKDLEKLEQCRLMPNQIIFPKHDDILNELITLTNTWTLSEAADAFVAGLWSAPFLWQSALSAKLIALAMPSHQYAPYSGSSDVCTVCGFHDRAVDPALLWYYRMTGGTPLDGEPVGHVLALREMDKQRKRPVPTDYDVWTFRAVLTVIRSMTPKSRYSKVRDALHKEKLLPTSNKWVYTSLLETLSLIGILDTEEYPGMAVQFTSYLKRDERPSVRVEPQAPLAWWDSSIGVTENTLKTVFASINCSSVSLTDKPAAVPPLSQTVTVRLEKQKQPRKSAPKSPDAGSGPAENGDVYAVCVRDDVWVTVYCHRIDESYCVVEYLDGVFAEMPMKPQLRDTVRPRGKGRWQMRASRMDKTTGIKRVARNMPVPSADLPEPDRIPHGGAKELKYLAHWCFPELDDL